MKRIVICHPDVEPAIRALVAIAGAATGGVAVQVRTNRWVPEGMAYVMPDPEVFADPLGLAGFEVRHRSVT